MQSNESPFKSFENFEKNETNNIIIELIIKCSKKVAGERICINEVFIFLKYYYMYRQRLSQVGSINFKLFKLANFKLFR